MTEILSAKPTSHELPNHDFERKPFKKNSKGNKLAPESIDNIIPSNSTKPNDLPKLSGYHKMTKGDLDGKISNLIDFGLNFEIKLPEHQKSKIKNKGSIKMSDFVRKSVQKKILDFHHIDELVGNCSEKTQKLEKQKKVENHFSTRNLNLAESEVVKPSKSSFNLPPLTPTLMKKFKSSDCLSIKEDSLKKLDSIVDSCKELLEEGKRRSNKFKTYPMDMKECKSR